MDFGRVLQTVAGFFERTGFRYAIIGASGLHAYGPSRGTFDLDFVTHSSACRFSPGDPVSCCGLAAKVSSSWRSGSKLDRVNPS